MSPSDTSCLPVSSPVTVTLFPTRSPKAAKLTTTAAPRTLADVSAALQTADGTAPERLKVLAAAVRTAVRLLQRPSEVIPAEPKLLLPMLAQLTPAATGRSAKTIDNMRSLVKEALIVVRAGRRVRYDGTPLSPAWKTL